MDVQIVPVVVQDLRVKKSGIVDVLGQIAWSTLPVLRFRK
jgi:hypothetical protein